MLSFKRFLYIILAVAVLGGIFLIYSINESRPAEIQVQRGLDAEREFIGTSQVEKGEKPEIWILGDPGYGCCEEIYGNVRRFCEDLHLTVAGEGYLDVDKVEEQDLVILCDDSIRHCADLAELESFIAGGGRVILAAGLAEGDEDSQLWPIFGIREKTAGENYHNLVFDKPFLPVQPEKVYYAGNSCSARIEVDTDASVYIRDAENSIPILYTYAWKKGNICLINGTFLTDIRCMGLLTGAISALVTDFVYPVLGVKAVFLDNFPTATAADDELCRQMYGYSVEGFVREVVWPAFQGISLRTDTPYTLSISAEASSEDNFERADDTLFTAIGNSVLQFGGELVYAANCPEDEKLKISDADIRFLRGMLASHDMRFVWEDGYTVFPAATVGNSMEDGNLFAIYSVLGAYGMVSHVFDMDMLITSDSDAAAWDSDKRQVSLFESEILDCVPWLEGRTLSQTEDDVRSYQDMDYDWTMSGNRMELHCSDAVKGQAFFCHTGGRIVDAEGLAYQDVGNGYYFLRVQKNDGIIIFE